jgi:hypothetical protein|tara:strand:+ start:6920 stop:7171 length:252 start_codon:yes stop_codon:yes gene_type:complete
MEHKEFESIEPVLAELEDDITVPKNVRMRIEKVIEVLNNNLEISIKVSKALNELEELADDVNLQSYTRSQIWTIISVLEKVKK